jgi:hypothetical protein
MGEGFVINMETKRGQPGRYRLSGQSMDEAPMRPELPLLTKPVQPCNRPQKAEIDQEDSGCKPGCTGYATAFATANPMGGNGKSPPVARLQGFHAPTEEDLEIPDLRRRCAHCGGGPESGNPVNRVVAPDGQTLVPVHRACSEAWMKEAEGGDINEEPA